MLPSPASNVVEFPVRHDHAERDSLEHEIVLELATADDVAAGMVSVVERIRRDSGAAGAEWWAMADDGTLALAAARGSAFGAPESLPLGGAGVLVLHDGLLDPEIESAMFEVLENRIPFTPVQQFSGEHQRRS